MADLARINKLRKLRGLFLGLGIGLIVFGFVMSFVYGFIYGYETTASGGTPVTDFSNPTYMLVVSIASALINGGIVLLILRVALLGTMLRREMRRVSESSHTSTYYRSEDTITSSSDVSSEDLEDLSRFL